MSLLHSTTAHLLHRLAEVSCPDPDAQARAFRELRALAPADQQVARWARDPDAPDRVTVWTVASANCNPEVLHDKTPVTRYALRIDPDSGTVAADPHPAAATVADLARFAAETHSAPDRPRWLQTASADHFGLTGLISRRSLTYQSLAARGDLPPPAPEPEGFWIQRGTDGRYCLARYDALRHAYLTVPDPAAPFSGSPPLSYPPGTAISVIAADAQNQGWPLARVAGKPVVRPYPDPHLERMAYHDPVLVAGALQPTLPPPDTRPLLLPH